MFPAEVLVAHVLTVGVVATAHLNAQTRMTTSSAAGCHPPIAAREKVASLLLPS